MTDLSVRKIHSLQEAQKYKPPTPPDYSSREIIIKFRDGITFTPESLSSSSPHLNKLFKKLKISKAEKAIKHTNNKYKDKHNEFGLDQIYIFKLPGNTDIPKVIEELRMYPEFKYVEPNYEVKTVAIPNDPAYPSQWALPMINAPAAWDINTGNSSVVVAVLDTGVEYTHPDLAANIWTNPGETPSNGIDDDGNGYIDDYYGWNFLADNNNSLDDHMHGTHVAGIVGAIGNNSAGCSGLNWGVKIMPVKFLGSSGRGFTPDAVNSIIYAAENGADIINNSWGGGYYSQALQDAINYAHSLGSIVVASAGNDNTSIPLYPASMNNVISVAATDSSDQKAGFSNYGDFIDLAAPGDFIYSTLPSNSYGYASGTSMAAPYVSGLAALVKAQNPSFSHQQIVQAMIKNTDDLGTPGWDNIYGYGRINALNAIQALGVLSSDITAPPSYSIVSGTINIDGTSDGSAFDHYVLEWGLGETPSSWSSAGISLTGGGTSVITNGTLGTLDTTVIGSDGLFSIRLRSVNTTADNFDDNLVLYKAALLKNGWPIAYSAAVSGSHPTLADINNDNKEELITSRWDNTTGGLYVMNELGANLPGFPLSFDIMSSAYSSPAIGNFLNETNSELAVQNLVYSLKLLNSNGTTASGWPKYMGDYNVSSHFSVGDLNNDDKDELIGLIGQSLYVYNGVGTLLPGWPKAVNSANDAYPGYNPTPGIADIDGNGFNDIVLPLNTGELHVYSANGTELPGWPKTGLGNIDWQCSSPAIADVDGDGQYEIFMAFNDTLHAWNHDGSALAGWPKIFSGGSFQSGLAIGNLTGDTKPEIVAIENGNGNNLYAFDYAGNMLPGFPVTNIFSKLAGPLIVDIDGDSDNEIIAANWFPARIEVIQNDGTALPGWPFSLPNGEVVSETPCIGDIDGDNKNEMIVSGWDQLYCFDLRSIYAPTLTPWRMFNQDAQHTACLEIPTINTNSEFIPGYVNDGSGTDKDFQSSSSNVEANWGGFIDPRDGIHSITSYDHALGTTPFSTNIAGWSNVGLAYYIDRTGLALTNGTIIYSTLRIENTSGTPYYASSDGVIIDTTPPQGYVNDGLSAIDMDYQASPTILYGKWFINDVESGIKNYTVSFGTSPGAIDVLGWTSAAQNTSMNAPSGLINGQTYYVNVRATNNAGLGIEFSSDGVLVDSTPPTGIINDGPGLDTDFQTSLTNMLFNWNISDLQSGITNISYSIGTNINDTSIVNWTSLGNNVTSFTQNGLSLINNQTYYVNLRAWNKAWVLGYFNTDGVTVLAGPPAAPAYVNDGPGIDIDIQGSTTNLKCNHSRVPFAVKYWYAIGTNSGISNVMGWTDNGSSTNFDQAISLILGKTYETSIRSENMFGAKSIYNTSDGVLIGDLIPPQITAFQANKDNIKFKAIDLETGLNETTLNITIKDQNNAIVLSYTGVGSSDISYDPATGQIILDHTLFPGTYTAEVSVDDNSGNNTVSSTAFDILPDEYKAFNYPNPFVSSKGPTTIHYEMLEDGFVTINIYNKEGILVKELLGKEWQGSGFHEVTWAGTGRNDRPLKEAPYFCFVHIRDKDNNKIWSKKIKIMLLE